MPEADDKFRAAEEAATRRELDTKDRRIAELKVLLRKYAGHAKDCGFWHEIREAHCDCGLKQLRKLFNKEPNNATS